MDVNLSTFQPSLDISSRRIAVDPATRRIAVRIASWEDVHSGYPGRVRMPRSVNVDAAHVGAALLEDGSSLRVATLPMHTTHAPNDMSAMHAASWYENTGKGVARVRYSTDEVGIRADGVLYDDITDADLDRITASAPSGDWKIASAVRRPQDFENAHADFVGACIVNIPGFADSYSQDAATPLRLAASAGSFISFEEGAVDIVAEAETVDETTDETTESEECPPGPACTGCDCGRAASSDTDASGDEADVLEGLKELHAAATAQVETVTSLIAAHQSSYGELDSETSAASAPDGPADHDAEGAAYEDRMRMLETRLDAIEQLLARALLDM